MTTLNETVNVELELKKLKNDAIQNDAVLDKLNDSDLNKILFPVEKVLSSDLLPEYKTISEYSHKVVGNIDGQKTILNCCSNRYELIQNVDIFPTLIHLLLNDNVDFDIKTSFNADLTQFTASLKVNSNKIELQNGDEIFPQINITHSYDGKLQYSIMFGYFRMICSNGMVIPAEGTEHLNYIIKGKHTQSILNSFNILTVKVKEFIERTEIANPYFELEKNKVINVTSRIEDILEKTGIKNPADKTVKHVLDRIESEKIELGLNETNDWLIYNGLNHYINNTSKKNVEVRNNLDIKVLNTLLQTA